MIKIDNISHFNNTFLSLISKVCDNACIKVDSEKLYSITNSSDNTIVIFSTYKQINEDIRLCKRDRRIVRRRH